MLAVLTWLALISLLALGVVAISLWVLRRNRQCPSCRAPLVPLATTEPLHAYEVLCCRKCNTAVTLSVGQRSRFAWCPQCRQRALEAPCLRLPAPEGQVRVEVREQCHLCGHQASRILESAAPVRSTPRGQVIPFPVRHDDDDEEERKHS